MMADYDDRVLLQANVGDRRLKMEASTTATYSHQQQKQEDDFMAVMMMDGNNSPMPSDLRYRVRNERVREVCRRAGVVTHDPVFVTHQNSSQPIGSSSSSGRHIGLLLHMMTRISVNLAV